MGSHRVLYWNINTQLPLHRALLQWQRPQCRRPQSHRPQSHQPQSHQPQGAAVLVPVRLLVRLVGFTPSFL